jgi:hypothetical protein
MTHYAWPEIESFHNIRKYAKAHPEILKGTGNTLYRAKVKLHGTNAAVQVHSDGTVIAQSRTQTLTEGNDNAGFAKWVKENEEQWKAFGWKDLVVFGEWCGKGIQGGVAISSVEKKVFAVFAIKQFNSDHVIVEPEQIMSFVKGFKDTYVLPWYGGVTPIDWTASSETLEPIVEAINKDVNLVETNDPWVEATFGVKGTGEGLVYYPITDREAQEHQDCCTRSGEPRDRGFCRRFC